MLSFMHRIDENGTQPPGNVALESGVTLYGRLLSQLEGGMDSEVFDLFRCFKPMIFG
jgi:hypothetical protein